MNPIPGKKSKTSTRPLLATARGVASCLLALISLASPAHASAPSQLDNCNVTFTSPSKDASGAVPLGNGALGASAWFEPNGDLVMYLSSPDSFSGTPNLLKLGRLRISTAPSFLAPGSAFTQTLRLREGRLEADLGASHWELFIDPVQPLVRVSVRSEEPFRVLVTNEIWRTEPTAAGGWSGLGWRETPDTVLETDAAAMGSYHRNDTTVTAELLKLQSCDQLPGAFDPLKNRTFGLWVASPDLKRRNAKTLESAEAGKTLDLRIAGVVGVTETPGAWVDAARSITASADAPEKARARAAEAWQSFWDRSWVLPVAPPPPTAQRPAPVPVAQAYALQRYVTACQGKGEFPIKFNGGIFTVDPHITNPRKQGSPDYREWGDAFWYQNTRHMYHPLLSSGDFELLNPFFRLYERTLPLAEARTKSWYNAQGAFFPETMTVFGAYAAGDYGRNRAGRRPGDVESAWTGRIWTQGLELASLMFDYWDWTEDRAFALDRLLPMALSVLRYYDTRFGRDQAGYLIIAPTQVIETYQTGVTNDIVSLSGLRAVLSRLRALPDALLNAEQKDFAARMQAACPPLPTLETALKGRKTRVLAPAAAYDPRRSNVENPELYAIWPFRLYGIGKPDLEIARNTYAARKERLDNGWGYDGNAAALLGLTEEARRIILAKCANAHPAHRFPASWGPNYDWLPDMNHGGNLMETLELMLLQADDSHIYLLPAWPRDWDCQFKLHAPRRTVVEGEVKNGKLTRLQVFPPSRRDDVVTCWD